MQNIFYINTKNINLKKIDLIPWKDRIEKINNYRYEKDKILSLGSGLLLKAVFCKYNIPYSHLKKNPYGKLYIDENIFFNISHSGEYAVLVYGDCQNGIDIEKKDINGLNVAKNYFTHEEYVFLLKNPNLFSTFWTLKESYVKMLGKGLTIPLDSFQVNYDIESNFAYIKEDVNAYFKVLEIEDYIVSVCSRDSKCNCITLNEYKY